MNERELANPITPEMLAATDKMLGDDKAPVFVSEGSWLGREDGYTQPRARPTRVGFGERTRSHLVELRELAFAARRFDLVDTVDALLFPTDLLPKTTTARVTRAANYLHAQLCGCAAEDEPVNGEHWCDSIYPTTAEAMLRNDNDHP